MSLLPNGVVKHTEVNPNTLVLFGHTKQGKTTLVTSLEDNLIIDLEGGTRYYDCVKIDVPETAETMKLTEWEVLKEIIKELKEYKEKHGKNKYSKISLDTVGRLEEITMPLAIAMHMAEPRNKAWRGSDLRTVPNGAGWLPIRKAFFQVIATLEMYCDTVILVAHTKDKTINRRGNELGVTDIDVSGKMSQMLAANADAIGLVYRKDNKTIVSFTTSELIVSGSRVDHLKEKEIVLAETDENGEFTFHWDEVFK